jgi:hypothetical protein
MNSNIAFNVSETSSEVTLEDLKNDSYVPILTQKDVEDNIKYVNEKRKNGLVEKLLRLKINYRFNNEYGGNVNETELYRLSKLYRSNIKEIKDHILYAQCGSIVTYINKGYYGENGELLEI